MCGQRPRVDELAGRKGAVCVGLFTALRCLAGLEVEGLFRISALLTDVEKLGKQWKKGKLPDLEHQDVHTVACECCV